MVDLFQCRLGKSSCLAEAALLPEEITTPTPDNRLIAWPYTKLMVANPSVNMGGAILITSLAKARAAGIAEGIAWIHIHGGASAEEPRDYLTRDQFFESHAQNAVIAGGDGELCRRRRQRVRRHRALQLLLPACAKMARRTLGLGAGVQPTVTGGLTFFGAPLNTYMTHAACAMVRRAAQWRKTRFALRPGWFCHQASCAGAVAAGAANPAGAGHQRAGRGRPARGTVPEFVTEAGGKGSVESFTVIYGRNGEVEHGVVMLRTSDDARALARVPARDGATLAHLLDPDRSPVGSSGEIVTAADGVLEWRV